MNDGKLEKVHHCGYTVTFMQAFTNVHAKAKRGKPEPWLKTRNLPVTAMSRRDLGVDVTFLPTA